MMRINLELLVPAVNAFVPALDEAQTEVNNTVDPAERAALINSYRQRWVALRDLLAAQSAGKCWYTESLNPGTDDDVDHFRPKNSVATDPGEAAHDGYFWLAFYWRNFRLSCHRANRLRRNVETGVTGGKGDRFPLNDPSRRLQVPTRVEADLDSEQPLLLDPTRPRDVAIITFTVQGYVALHPHFVGNTIETRRLEASRVFYNLDFKEFKEARVKIYNLVKRKVDQGNRCAPPQGSPSYVRTAEFDTIVSELKEMMNRDQCFSAAARSYIMTCRDSWWVDMYVLELLPPAPSHGGGTSSGSASN